MRGLFAVFWAGLSSLAAARDLDEVILSGAGATFPAPLYRKWIAEYEKETGCRVTYEATGSGGGIERLLAKKVDFAGTDAFLPEDQLEQNGTQILHIPTCVGGVAVAYNLEDVTGLRLTPTLVADIFFGKLKSWSHPALRRANPDLELPDTPITVIHRADSSGTTFQVTDYLCKISDAWRKRVGRGKTVRWPHGVGADGNKGVALLAQRIPGSLCYLQYAHADKYALAAARLENRAGNYVLPRIDSLSHAANTELPEDTRALITDTDAEKGYPISSFTWLIVHREQSYDQRSRTRCEALVKMLEWMLDEGQAYNEEMLYAPLPPAVARRARRAVRSITYKGGPVEPEGGDE